MLRCLTTGPLPSFGAQPVRGCERGDSLRRHPSGELRGHRPAAGGGGAGAAPRGGLRRAAGGSGAGGDSARSYRQGARVPFILALSLPLTHTRARTGAPAAGPRSQSLDKVGDITVHRQRQNRLLLFAHTPHLFIERLLDAALSNDRATASVRVCGRRDCAHRHRASPKATLPTHAHARTYMSPRYVIHLYMHAISHRPVLQPLLPSGKW